MMTLYRNCLLAAALLIGMISLAAPDGRVPQEGGPIQLLFLGDRGHHLPSERVVELKHAFGKNGIFITYTENLEDLNPENLARYDGLMVYANIGGLSQRQEQAVLDYVASGKGYIPVHCASACFGNNPKMVELLGGQFKSHGTGTFRTRIVKPDHPVTKGFEGFESWDETYVHHRHNEKDRTVLSYREDEPWTWVRTHGNGRVFYTAWGHDQRTWKNEGFQELLRRGVLWAVGDDARSRFDLLEMPEFKFTEAEVPNYERRDPPPKFQHPLSAEESMKTIQVPAGFDLSLFASDPQISNVGALAWDGRGRCWVAETRDYPNNLKPEAGEGEDAIKILEDTNGDGRCDKVTVFADKLSIPTSIVFARGGIIVTQAPHTLFLKDTDGDDVADVREIMFSGWGTGDTHAGPSSLHYGFDNWIYGSVGYSGFRGEVGGERHGFSNGFYRFKPDGSKMEFLAKSSNNTWGFGISETGELFGSTANNTHSLHIGMPQRLFDGAVGLTRLASHKLDGHYGMTAITDQVRQVDVHGGYTAAAGHNLYTARTFPREYWNRIAFVNEPTCHLVHQCVLEPEGSGFKERDGRNLLASADAWCAPVFSQVGPDGQVWVADWYDFIIQHNPLPKGFKMGKGNAYITPLREHKLARIYRVTYGSKAEGYPNLLTGDPGALIATLGHPNLFWRLTAQRLLVEREQVDVVSALNRILFQERKLDAIGSDPQALHALWTLQGLQAVSVSTIAQALRHAAPSVRRAAITMMPRNSQFRGLVLSSGALGDNSPSVQLAALLALIEMPPTEAIGPALVLALKKLEGSRDHWIPAAFSLAAIYNAASFLDALVASLPPAGQGKVGEPGAKKMTVNLIPNAGFEVVAGKNPKGWQTRTWSGEPMLALETGLAASGKHCIRVSADKITEAGYFVEVDVKPHMIYRLRGWVKTDKVQGGGRGAMFYLPEVAKNGSRAIKGTQDWIRIEHTFDTGNIKRLRINCLFGGWGKVTGTAWFDDIELVALHPSLGDHLNIGVSSSVARNYAAKADETSLKTWLLRLPAVNSELVGHLIEGFARGWPAGTTVKVSSEELANLQGLLERLSPARQTDLMKLALKAGVSGLVGRSAPVDLGDTSQAVVVKIGPIKEQMLFDKPKFTVSAGRRIKLVFENTDTMPHNIVIGRPGSLERMGAAADKMLKDPKAMDRGYVPVLPEVIASMGMVFPGQTEVLDFTAPKVPGDYDFVCTFPGHWRLMKGVMTVVKP
ncbi:MAG: PVC-type heme-binding CxxCH protein [Roseibacillus sp.]